MNRVTASAIALCVLAGPASAQIIKNEGDGVLNAPYRGTIDSLRECSIDIPYGEVKSHVEPTNAQSIDTSDPILVWHEGESWDRSVLRLYNELDASGQEIDLTNYTSQAASLSLPRESYKRFSFKAIGIRTLSSKTFTIKFHYTLEGFSPSTYTEYVKVAPITGSFCDLPGESEMFNYGTPVLDVSVGGARLVVPIGQGPNQIGAAFSHRVDTMGPTGIDAYDVVLPGAAESVWLQDAHQFQLGWSDYAKSDWGTPWPGYLPGYYSRDNDGSVQPTDERGDAFGPDGTHYDSEQGFVASTTARHFDKLRPRGLAADHPATQVRTYNTSDPAYQKLTRISDQATPPNYIELDRSTGGTVEVTTSDGRGWDIKYNNNSITAVVPHSGKGARYFAWSRSVLSGGRVTEVRDAAEGGNTLYRFTYTATANGDLLTEERYVDGATRTVVQHDVVTNGLSQRKEYFGPGANDYRQFDLVYDSTADPQLNHRLKSITSYAEPAGQGAAFTTEYEHDVENADGTMAITEVRLPNDTIIEYEYAPTSENFGFRTKATQTGPSEETLVTYDVDYEFFYNDGGTKLFYAPRLVKQRDGRGVESEVTFDYENGGQDENSDGLDGERSNQLRSRTGPTITRGTSGTRTPQTRYTFDPTDRVLTHQETDYASGAFRVIDFGHDELLRMTSQTFDPGGENLVTQYLYCDAEPTQDRITVDPDGYWTRTQYDDDGRLALEQRFLNANAGTVGQPCDDPTGPFYGTTYVYGDDGWLDQRIVDNKDQDGTALVPATVTTQYTHDLLGRLTLEELDPGGIGQQSNFDYNWLGEVEEQYDTSGRGTKSEYDGRGLVKSETPLASGQVEDEDLATTFEYDAVGNLRFTYPPTSPVGPHTENVYDEFSRVEQVIRHPGSGGGNQITTTYEYDDASNVTRTYVDEATVGTLSDTTVLYDEGGFNYESRQRTVVGADNPADPVTQRKFDWAGNVLEETALGDATVDGRVITTYYDDANRVRRITDSEGGETVYERDDRGNVEQQTVKLNATESAVTNTVYDALSRAVEITGPEDSVGGRPDRIRRYDSRGNLLRESVRDAGDVAKMTTVFAYDNAGRQTRRALLANAQSTIPASDADVTTDRVVESVYDEDGRLEFRYTYNNTLAQTLETSTTYDPIGRVDRVTDPSTSYTDANYTTKGRLSQREVFDGVGVRTFTFGYDGHDRVTSQTAVGSPSLTTAFAFDGLDRQVGLNDPKTIKTKTDYDLVGRREGLTEDFEGGLERQTAFAYNRLSQLTSQTAGNKANNGTSLDNQVTAYRYDSLGRLEHTVYPDASQACHDYPEACTDAVHLQYDLAGRMTQRTDQRQRLTEMTYDDRGLLLTRTTDTDLDTFDYDALGRMTMALRGTTTEPDAVSALDCDYTGLGDLDYETQSIAQGTPRTVDYGYDQAGNRTRLEYPGGEVLTYVPTAINQVDSISLDGSPLVDYDYNGRVLDTSRTTTDDPGGGTVYECQMSYDDHRRITGVTNRLETPARGVETIADFTFTLDDNGNPLTQSADGMADFAADDRTFTVDRLDRLTGTTYNETGTTEESTLDLLGNRESHTTRAGETIVYGEVNPANEYVSIAGSAVFYDEAGNLEFDEDGRQYSYDEHNRLTQVKAADETVLANYTYDALGRRIAFEDPVAGTTVRYYYAGQSVIEEYDASPGRSEQRLRYLVNGGQYIDERIVSHDDTTGQSTYYLANRNHSIAGTGNADGSVIERLDYSSGGDFGGGEPQPPDEYYFDTDGDGDIDLTDYADFHACFGGPGKDMGADCDLHDWHLDFDVDFADHAAFQFCFSGDGGTPPAVCLLSQGFCPVYYFDGDFDGDVDLADHADFESCLAGPDVDRIAGCSMHDIDADYDVDLADHAAFAECYSDDGWSPASGCCQPARYYHDADFDGDVDMSDYSHFTGCYNPGVEAPPECLYPHDYDNTQSANGRVDAADNAGFWACFNGPRKVPPDTCRRDEAPTKSAKPRDETPPSGTFALHGRPIDVLSDGHVLIYIRNRYYDPKHSRWLQRDRTGYTDGANLYEAFRSNASRNTDPMGRQIVPDEPMRNRLIRRYFTVGGAMQRCAGIGDPDPVCQWMIDILDPAFERAAVLAERTEPVVARVTGGVQVVGGVCEAGTGVIVVIGSAGFGVAPGTVFTLHGTDVTQAGLRQVISGEFTPTETYSTIAEAGYPTVALCVDTGISVGSGYAAFSMGDELFTVPSRFATTTATRTTKLFDVLEQGYERVVVVLFDAKPGEVVLGSGLSPGRVGAPGEQLLFEFAQPPPARVIFGELDELGRATGVHARITPELLNTGTRATSRVQPLGFGGRGLGHARGHLLARSLGGSGEDPRNLVTLFQNPTNTPVMSSFEYEVLSAVRGGQTVDYWSLPVYEGTNPIPLGVTLRAESNGPVGFYVTVLNRR